MTTSSVMHPESAKNVSSRPPAVEEMPAVEFAVNFDRPDHVHMISDALSRRGMRLISSNLVEKTIQVSFDMCNDEDNSAVRDVQSLQKYIEDQTGFLAVIKGMGQHESAVAELRPPPRQFQRLGGIGMFGVVRMSQMTDNTCFIDGLIDGPEITPHFFGSTYHEATPRRLRLALHEFGDLSGDDYDSIGNAKVTVAECPVNGDPGSEKLSISVQRIVTGCKVAEFIGKSVALSLINSENVDDCNSMGKYSEVLAAGVVARASTVEANRKHICTCSGKTLWQERAERRNDS